MSEPPGSSEVTVSVFVYCDDLRVAIPRDIHSYEERAVMDATPALRGVVAESGMIEHQDVGTSKIGATSYLSRYRSTCPVHMIFEKPSEPEKVNLDFFGEEILSFRQLLKRYHESIFFDTDLTTTSDGSKRANLSHPHFPTTHPQLVPCYDTAAESYNLTSDYTQANFDWNLFEHLRYSFVGMRGAMRYVVMTDDDSSSKNMTIRMNYVTGGNRWEVKQNNPNDKLPIDGGFYSHDSADAIPEINVPYYSNNLFELSHVAYADSLEPTLLFDNMSGGFRFTKHYVSSSSDTKRFRCSFAAGEDFNFLLYQGGRFYTNLSTSDDLP
jgi:hypothetical protein